MPIMTQLELLPSTTAPIVYGPFISRKQAKAQGLRYYFTGEPCKYGHVSIRYIKGQCVACCKRPSKPAPKCHGPFLSLEQAASKGLKLYFTGHACPVGHIAVRRVKGRGCTQCERLRALEARNQNVEARNAKTREWKAANKSAVSEYNRAYGAANRHRIKERCANRYASDPGYAIEMRLRSRLYEMITKAGAAKSGRFREIVGVDRDQLRQHLERQFALGMNWDNRHLWHVDHVRPCASFDLNDPNQQRQCFHYTNLQPLWAADNIRKGAKWDGSSH